MGHWQSFPEIFLDHLTPPKVGINRVTDTSWINSYGNAAVDIRYDGQKVTFIFDGNGGKKYEADYILNKSQNYGGIAVNHASKELVVSLSSWFNFGINQYDYVYVTQLKEFTPSGSDPLHWELAISLNGSDIGKNDLYVSVQPGQTTTSSPVTKNVSSVQPVQLLTSLFNPVTIQITLIPEGSFQDIASVTFDIHYPLSTMRSSVVVAKEDELRHGCAKGKYKQLLSKSKSGTQRIHVFAPLVTCYLAGEGDFSTEKMYSVNKIVGPVWPEVFLYAMTKFILNRLMNGIFEMDILYRRHTKKFLEQLSRSEYSNFVDYFSENTDKERYFLR